VVEDSGKTLRADAYRPVNTPEPLSVEEMPRAACCRQTKARQAVISIEDSGASTMSGGAPGRSRASTIMSSRSGQRLVLYKDLITGKCISRIIERID